jgi:mRNA-degrading endonuclease YafQ of YafQ-DinJ toxin-antitoxin module
MRIIYSPHFVRQYKKLERDIQAAAEEKEKIFLENPFDIHLKTHKLHGRLSNLWAFWVTRKVRLTFEFGEENSVIFHTIGTHDIYD